ncbi:MAG: RluA family pseudouridine synthase, partial [Bdellovibrionales bacterium]|nr:RluA family pseudouridine synthase [Bdellovibrionales bacterium]NQZ19489.1 RluA family pseudouridine synthase [Bdellovibrionales bacterium]
MSNNEEEKSVSVAETLSQMRLDVGMVTAGLIGTRSQAQKLIDNDKVRVNGKKEKASYKLQLGDQINVTIPAPKSIELIPYDFPIDVVYEDNSVIVVNKPAGLVV